MVAELINKYIWIIQTLMSYGSHGLKLEEIQDRWMSRWDEEYSRKTFHNHRKSIEEIFNIEIACNRHTNCYYIKNAEDVSDETANSQWLINTFTVNSLLEMGKERLSGRIAVEDIPSGQTYLTVVMDAMLDSHVMEVAYQKYGEEEVNVVHVRPYALKEFMKRWYLVGYCEERAGLRTYGLDRIRSIRPTTVDFKFPVNWDVDSHFAGCFGVSKEEKVKIEEIWFATTQKEANYLKDLPIHESQERMEVIPEELLPLPEGMEVVFRIHVAPNYSLMQEFCKYMDKLVVLAPDGLRAEMAETLARTAKLYG